MSSTEPPSRIPPRHGAQESKASRDELSSKRKVEKVREVDPDEQAKKKRFQEYYKDSNSEDTEIEKQLSPIDFYAKEETKKKGSLGSSESNRDEEEEPNQPAAAPPPPYLQPQGAQNFPEEKEPNNAKAPLPQSDDFWDEVSSSYEPKSIFFEETLKSEKKELLSNFKEKKENPLLSPLSAKKGTTQKEEHEAFSLKKKRQEIEERTYKALMEKQRDSQAIQAITAKEKDFLEKKGKAESTKEKKEKEVEFKENRILPMPSFETRQDTPHEEKGGSNPALVEIDSPSSPPLPPQVVPIAGQATTQAAPYLQPETVSLFYQMVGTVYVMQNTGVNRTEIMLNSPSFAGSRFFGASIIIEKYSTAPDSFNIRLTGSSEAVIAFRENIPSLMNAFSNNNLSFRVNRLDAEYTQDRPIFRRKEGRKGGSSSGEGGLGEGRK